MSKPLVAPAELRSGSLKNLLAAHPFVSFFVLTFAGAWLFLAPMVLGQDGLGLLPYHVPFAAYVILFLAASFTGPTLAALVVTAALDGAQGIRRFLRRYIQWRMDVRWPLLTLLGFPALYMVAATWVMGLEAWTALVQQWPLFFSVYLPAVLVFPGLLQWGEEPGWRGFAQTRMQVHYGALQTSLVVGFLHGIWHLPIHLLVEGPPAAGPFDPANFALNTAIVMLLTVVLTWIFNGAGQSILVASLAHASFNATSAWIGGLIPDLAEQVGNVALILVGISAVALIVMTRGRIGYERARIVEPTARDGTA